MPGRAAPRFLAVVVDDLLLVWVSLAGVGVVGIPRRLILLICVYDILVYMSVKLWGKLEEGRRM